MPDDQRVDPEVIVSEKPLGTWQGTRTRALDGGYEITAERGKTPTGSYDPRRYRMERDPASTAERECWRIVKREQEG